MWKITPLTICFVMLLIVCTVDCLNYKDGLAVRMKRGYPFTGSKNTEPLQSFYEKRGWEIVLRRRRAIFPSQDQKSWMSNFGGSPF